MKTAIKFDRGELPITFRELSELHVLRPINDDVDFEGAQELSDALAVLDKRTRDQDDYLESLSVLMEHYEKTRCPIDTAKVTPAVVLKYLMDSHEMSESDLGRLLGERSLGNAVVSGRRSLSKAHIRTLAAHFKVSADLLI